MTKLLSQEDAFSGKYPYILKVSHEFGFDNYYASDSLREINRIYDSSLKSSSVIGLELIHYKLFKFYKRF